MAEPKTGEPTGGPEPSGEPTEPVSPEPIEPEPSVDDNLPENSRGRPLLRLHRLTRN